MPVIRTTRALIFLFIFLCIGCSSKDEGLNGYIEGEYTYVATGISGTLLTLNVKRGQNVKKDQLLFQLDPQPDLAAKDAALATVEQIQAELSLAKVVLERYKNLYAHNATDKNTLDEKQNQYDTKEKELQSAQNNLTESTWSFNQKTVYSPITGRVFDTFYRIGEKVAANQPVLAILAPENIKVLFYIPEKKLSMLKLGQQISFRCDSCKTATQATISYISPEAEYTPPVIYSAETRTNLVYLIRADIPQNLVEQFHPGQPLDIDLNEK